MNEAPSGLRACFELLVELAPLERERWLAGHALDPALRQELLALLAADRDAAPLLSGGAAALVQHYTPAQDDGLGLIGSSIGPYRLIEVLGQGGTAVVFRAQRASGAGTQTVALKLLRTGLFSVDGQRRFRREQGVLAQLSHPHIARLIEGGISAAGIPYIAMEFVDGSPITQYANAHALDLRARIALLVTVCRTIDSAHRTLVVHRDLKPSNVLVTFAGEIKVLDFGIARLLDEDDHHVTQTSAIALTPGYAAPEQYLPGPVTTATDIYALGILMGELLTGQLLPRGRTRYDLSRAFIDASLPVPRGLLPLLALTRSLRGDLDAIYNTAHAHDPAHRYLSAALLADDLECYLNNLPVTARTPTAWYRLRKSMQRNRAVASAAILGVLALAIGVSLALWQAHVAHGEAQRATAVRDFLVELFDAARAGQLPDQRLTLEQLVHRAGARLKAHTELAEVTRVELLRTLGEVSLAGSDYNEAGALFDQALASARTLYPPDDAELMRIELLQASLLLHQSRYSDAGTAYAALLPHMRRNHDAAAIEGMQNYASALMYSAHTEQALAISAEAVRAAATLYGGGSSGAILADLAHADLLVGSGNYADAAPLLNSALAAWRDSQRAPTQEFLQALTDRSRVEQSFGDGAAAEASLRETVATAERLYDAPHDRIALALLNMGDLLRLHGRLAEAEPVLKRALMMMQVVYGDGHLRVANTLGALGSLELQRHDLDAASVHIHTAMQWCNRPGLHATRSCIELLADQTELGLASGNLEEADSSSARALAMAQEIFYAGHHWIAVLWQLRAALSLRRNDAVGALALCDQAWALLTRLNETRGLAAEGVLARRANTLNAMGRDADALVDIHQALSLWQKLAPAGALHEVALLDQLADTQSRLGDGTAARDSARRALGLVSDRAQLEPGTWARLELRAQSPHPGANH